MNSGLLLAVKPAMSGPNKISKPNLIITPRMLNVAREGRAETINPMVGPWLFFAVLWSPACKFLNSSLTGINCREPAVIGTGALDDVVEGTGTMSCGDPVASPSFLLPAIDTVFLCLNLCWLHTTSAPLTKKIVRQVRTNHSSSGSNPLNCYSYMSSN